MSNKLGNDRDCLTRFVLGRSGVRGALVRLNDTWQGIRQRTDYPTAVESCLGETCAAAALFTSHIKMEGRLSVQLRGTGVLRTLFAECTTAGTLRGIAHHGELLPGRLTPRAFGSDAILAISIETLAPGAREMQRYQGMVGLDADELSEAFESYFAQSEQLPTRIRLFGVKDVAAALMLQQLPEGHGDRDEGLAQLQASSAALEAAGQPCTTHIAVGHIAQTVTRYAAEMKFDLIVIGTHGRTGLRHAVMGSVATEVIKLATVPVTVVRNA